MHARSEQQEKWEIERQKGNLMSHAEAETARHLGAARMRSDEAKKVRRR